MTIWKRRTFTKFSFRIFDPTQSRSCHLNIIYEMFFPVFSGKRFPIFLSGQGKLNGTAVTRRCLKPFAQSSFTCLAQQVNDFVQKKHQEIENLAMGHWVSTNDRFHSELHDRNVESWFRHYFPRSLNADSPYEPEGRSALVTYLLLHEGPAHYISWNSYFEKGQSCRKEVCNDSLYFRLTTRRIHSTSIAPWISR
jgi:hypothetical protein